MSEHDITFDAMGSHVRLLIGEPGPGAGPGRRGGRARRGGSSTTSTPPSHASSPRASSAPSTGTAASGCPRRRSCARRSAPAWPRRSAATASSTRPCCGEIEGAGYTASRAGMPGVPLAEARRPARRTCPPQPRSALARFEVDEASGEVVRPPGLRFDTGGTGKGLAADLVAAGLRGYSRFIVDCGGDIRIGGADALVHPYEVFVEHPLTGESRLRAPTRLRRRRHLRAQRPHLAAGRRRYAHHLLDPSTGEPAWTGLVGATALADSAGRGGDALQGGAALRPRAARGSCSPSAAASSSTTAAASSSSARWRRRRGFESPPTPAMAGAAR